MKSETIFCPKKFLTISWSFPINIYHVDSVKVTKALIAGLMNEAKSQGANAYHLDFHKYNKPAQVFASISYKKLFSGIDSCSTPTLVILENVDAFASSNCQEAFTLRTCLESKMDRPLICVFSAKTVSIEHIFFEHTAPFYLSSCPLLADVER